MDKKTIYNIVKASGVSAGELVLVHFWGEDAQKETANDFVTSVAALGATPVLLQQARSVNRDIFLSARFAFESTRGLLILECPTVPWVGHKDPWVSSKCQLGATPYRRQEADPQASDVLLYFFAFLFPPSPLLPSRNTPVIHKITE